MKSCTLPIVRYSSCHTGAKKKIVHQKWNKRRILPPMYGSCIPHPMHVARLFEAWGTPYSWATYGMDFTSPYENENVFQNPDFFPTQVSLSPEQSTLWAKKVWGYDHAVGRGENESIH
jgi:hypothetical protein